ncbi:hypothetical protein HN859_04540 [Candidatus Parcubacteria bacterium]|nr:hypothetical protein [Candidatus Parcubacteria bacterium]
MDSFEHQSTMYIHPDDYEKGNFIQFYIIHRVDPPYTTYVAEQDKIIDKDEKEEMTDKLHYFIDNPDDLGAKKLDEIRFIIDNDSSYFKNKPFTFFSKNGTDRLKLMNAFCQSRLGLPMYSGTMLEDEEHEFWKELVEEGLAQQYEEESGRDLKTRYKFKD